MATMAAANNRLKSMWRTSRLRGTKAMLDRIKLNATHRKTSTRASLLNQMPICGAVPYINAKNATPNPSENCRAARMCRGWRSLRCTRDGPIPIWAKISTKPTTTSAMDMTPKSALEISRASTMMKNNWSKTWLTTFADCHRMDDAKAGVRRSMGCLSGDAHGTLFPDDRDLHLTGVGHFVHDALREVE